MSTRTSYTWIPITVGLVALCAIGGFSVWRIDSAADRGSGLPNRFSWDVQDQYHAGQDQLGYEASGQWPLPLDEVRGIAVGPEDRVFIAGDQAVLVLDLEGKLVRTIKLDGPPRCVAVGSATDTNPSRLYAGVGKQIEVYGAEGDRIDAWTVPGKEPVITSIAVANKDVFVADAASRRVWHFDTEGNLLSTIGESLDSQSPGFIVPSPFFDVAVGAPGVLIVANPGARRLESYSFDGQLESVWGNTGSDVAGFFGCCNPAHFALFPDGRYATSEKGIPRVKTYREDGDFESLVAGPPQLGLDPSELGDPRGSRKPPVFDVAVDRRDRVLVLDPVRRQVLVFESRGRDEDSKEEVGDE